MPRDTLRLIIADDEPLARRLLKQYAKRVAHLEIVAECRSVGELESSLAVQQADAALTDIRVPGGDVFEMLARLADRVALPSVIFATAYDRYAVQAFEMNAVDYLVKPFTESRFAEALARVRERRAGHTHTTEFAHVGRDLGRHPDRVLVPASGHIVPLPVSTITWIKSEGDYARIHSKDGSYLVYRTLTELDERLDPAAFIRIHRSAIVRVDQIVDVEPADGGRYRLSLSDGTRLVVSRSRAGALKRLIL